MGRASRWLRSLLTFKKPSEQPPPDSKPPKDKTRWSFVKSSKHRQHLQNRNGSSSVRQRGDAGSDYGDAVDPAKHAIAVAAATAAVAEAAVEAAKAAAAVVKLTSSGRCDSSYYSAARCDPRERWASVVIQSAFRGYLARKALKALKALVRLQALVRGHIARKQTADQVRQMKALLRVQARARAGRVLHSESSQSSSKSSHHHPPGPATPEKFEEIRSRSPKRNQPSSLKRNSSRSGSRGTIGQINHSMDDRVWDPLMRTGLLDDQHGDKILEIDPGKFYSTSKRKNLFNASRHTSAARNQSHSLTTSKNLITCQAAPSSKPYEAMSLCPLKFSCELEEEASYCTAQNSPRFYSASSVGGGSSRGGPFTPTKSDSLHSYLSEYSDYPNYMSYTESSKAKLRSMSAPKQRPQYERSSSTKRYSYHALNESISGAQRLSVMHTSFANKAYPGSGRLDKLGMCYTRVTERAKERNAQENPI